MGLVVFLISLDLTKLVVNHMLSGDIDFVKLKEIWVTKPEFNSPRNIFSFNVAAGLSFSSTNMVAMT